MIVHNISQNSPSYISPTKHFLYENSISDLYLV